MLKFRFAYWIFPFGMMVLGGETVLGQGLSGKTVRIVTSEAGGGSDFAARLIAQNISGPLGRQVIVDNRPAGIIPGDIVSKAPPDGSTLLLYSNGLWTLPLMQKVPYDPAADFLPITLAARAPNTLVVHPSVPAKSVRELIAIAKARPGELNYASGGPGGSVHLAAELFKAMAGVNIVHIPYKGTGTAIRELIGGQVQIMFATAASIAPHVTSGRLRALAVTSAKPSALAPGVPTIAAAVPGYESIAITGLFAPAKTPAAIINLLNKEIVQALNRTDVKEKLFSVGVEAVGTSPDELAAAIKVEVAKMGKVIKDAGIRVD